MNPWFAAAILGCLGVLATFSVVRGLREGVARSFVREYRIEENPISYTICLLGDVGMIAFGVASVLYALGIIGNPAGAISAILPPFLRCPNYCGF
jgi:hypothetical protein